MQPRRKVIDATTDVSKRTASTFGADAVVARKEPVAVVHVTSGGQTVNSQRYRLLGITRWLKRQSKPLGEARNVVGEVGHCGHESQFGKW